MYCALSLLSGLLLIPTTTNIFSQPHSDALLQFISIALGCYAIYTFIKAYNNAPDTPPEEATPPDTRWFNPRNLRISALLWICAVFGVLAAILSLSPITSNRPYPYPFQPDPIFVRNSFYNPSRSTTGVTEGQCLRRPLPPTSKHPFNETTFERNFHAFDDVLLIVFFSHARYDVNLDNHRAVYAPYFPNVGVAEIARFDERR